MMRKEAAVYLLQHPAELGRRLGYTDLRDALHGAWMLQMLHAKDDMTLQAHRGSYKTTCLTIVIAMLLILERGKNIIFLRKTDTDVVEVITQVQHILESPIMQQIYEALTGHPLALLTATKSEITTGAYNAPRGAVQLLGIGLGGSLTGKHADIVITDDIVNLRDRISMADRDRTKAIYQELRNVCNRGGRFINTGTPWHKDDAFQLMPTPARYDCYETGLIDKDALEKLRNSMTPSLFAANYELRHIAAEDALFPEAVQWFDDVDYIRDGIAHIDASYGGEDYTAFTCGARVGDTLYMYGRMWHGHVDTVMDAAISEAERLMCSPIYCETNGDKGYLAKEIRRRGADARPYAEKQNKNFKISSFLRKWWANIKWLEGTDRDYLAQIQDYTEDAEHDDAPDSAACICRILDRE